MTTITVKGSNAIDENIKARALQSIANNLTTSQLEKINELATNPKARAFIDNKFNLLKSFL